jgi:hypothetical protein
MIAAIARDLTRRLRSAFGAVRKGENGCARGATSDGGMKCGCGLAKREGRAEVE